MSVGPKNKGNIDQNGHYFYVPSPHPGVKEKRLATAAIRESFFAAFKAPPGHFYSIDEDSVFIRQEVGGNWAFTFRARQMLETSVGPDFRQSLMVRGTYDPNDDSIEFET